MRLGLSSYTFGWAVGVPGHPLLSPLDEHGLLDRCLEHDIKLLQIGDNLPLCTFDQDRLAGLAERAVREGVQLEVGARRLTVENLKTHVSIARLLGARLVRFVIDDVDYHPTPEAIVKVLRQSAEMLTGIQLGIENHDRFPAASLRRIVEEAGCERIGICLDTANSIGAGEGLDTVLRELGPHTVNLHIKDFQIKRLPHLMGFTVEGRPAGSGQLDVPGLLERLAPFQRCETAVLELWTPPEREIERTLAREASWAASSLDYLKPLFKTKS